VLQGLVSWLLAILLGSPAAYFMVTRVLTTIFGDTLLYQFKPTGLLLWLAMILLLGLLVSWLPARKVTRVSVRERLAYTERKRYGRELVTGALRRICVHFNSAEYINRSYSSPIAGITSRPMVSIGAIR
jgi:hypothetical protein